MGIMTSRPYFVGGLDFLVNREIENLIVRVAGYLVLPSNVTYSYYASDSVDHYVYNAALPYMPGTTYHFIEAGYAATLPSATYFENMTWYDEQGNSVVCLSYNFTFTGDSSTVNE